MRATGHSDWRLEIDRAIAIREAVTTAAAGDVVVLAGKGHEAYQERGGARAPFSDYDEAAAALRVREEA